MKPHLSYLAYVLKHKWFVFVAGLHLKVPLWQLVTTRVRVERLVAEADQVLRGRR